MSAVEEGAEYAVLDEGEDPAGSLRERMEARAETLNRQRSEWFSLPGYDGVLEVELRTLGFRRIRHNVQRNQRVKDVTERELYAMVDNVVEATEGFREVRPDGSKPLLVDHDWVSLAQMLPECPDGATPRQSVLVLLGDDRFMYLVQEWSEWQRAGRSEVDEEVRTDF